MNEMDIDSESSDKNPYEGTSARTRPFSFEEIMLRRKNKIQTESAKPNNYSPKEPSRRDNSPKQPSKRDNSPKQPSRMDDSPKQPSIKDNLPKEPSRSNDLPNKPSRIDNSPREPSRKDNLPKEPSIRDDECKEDSHEFVEPKKERWRLASMVVSSNLEREKEKEEELDEKLKERDIERERKRSDDLERKKKKKNANENEEPVSKKRDLRNEIDFGQSEIINKSRERDKSTERSKRRRSTSRERLERERGVKSRERDRDHLTGSSLGGYSPRKRRIRNSPPPEKKSDKRDRTSERRSDQRDQRERMSERSPDRKSGKRNDRSQKSPERKSEKRNDRSEKSPERKSDKRKDRSGKSPERKSEKRKDISEKSPERKSEKRSDRSGNSPERKSEKRNDRSGKSPQRKSEKRSERSEKSPERKSEKRSDRSGKSPERKSEKRIERSEKRIEKSEKRNDRSERSPERKYEKGNDTSEQIPERKSDKWDQLPAGLPLPIPQLVNFGSILGTFKFPGTKRNVPVEPVQLTQATRPQRRLYIENINDSISEKMLIDGINAFFIGKNPCLACTINKEKGQALVEFLTPEDATKALSFEGKLLLGSVLKIRRPRDYVETPVLNVVTQEKPVEEEKVISNIVKDSPHKIFIAGISKSLSSEMLMEIVSVFGPLSAYRFAYNEELGAPCAFLEYIDHSVTLKACAGLNGMKLGGSILIVLPALLNEACKDSSEKPPVYEVPLHAKSLLVDPTEVLQLKNLFEREEFLQLSNSERDEILEDIILECTRFGTVKSVKIVPYIEETTSNLDEIITKALNKEEITDSGRDCKEESDETEERDKAVNGEERGKGNGLTGEDGFEAGSVLVEFIRKEAAQMAAHGLHGRLYADRVVMTCYVPLELYLKKFPK